MIRVGIDVGGTNTDAVIIDGHRVIGAVKRPTSDDVTAGIRAALQALLAAHPGLARTVAAVMIGTTHFVNAVIQRRGLNRAAAVRLCLPACASLPPRVDWPPDLAAAADGGHYLLPGGHEYDGRVLTDLDEAAVVAVARRIRTDGIDAVAVTAVFSPLSAVHEERAAAILRAEIPGLRITLSSQIGRIGLLERENVALLNASLADLAERTVSAFRQAMQDSGIDAPLYITRNDGTVAGIAAAQREPVFSFASGPTNSMRGAAFLSGLQDCMVLDIGGTSSDIGCLTAGFPREANNVVEVGGVRTLFRMPDLLSIALGGGTVVGCDGLSIGPESVAYRLEREALVFGGTVLTLTDVAVARGQIEIGDRRRVAALPVSLLQTTMDTIHARLSEAVDRMKTDAADQRLLVVGGAAFLAPERMNGISEVKRIAHHGVANAVGAAMAQVSGEVDQVFRDMSRESMLREAEAIACDRAIRAGALAGTLTIVDLEDLPLAYLPGNAVRVRARAVGDIDPVGKPGDLQ